jgi:hypothetical protein
LARKNQRNRRRAAVKDTARPTNGTSPDRYEKYLPSWMKSTNGAAPVRPARPRRQRQQRPAGGYTPGKFALGPLGEL